MLCLVGGYLDALRFKAVSVYLFFRPWCVLWGDIYRDSLGMFIVDLYNIDTRRPAQLSCYLFLVFYFTKFIKTIQRIVLPLDFLFPLSGTDLSILFN